MKNPAKKVEKIISAANSQALACRETAEKLEISNARKELMNAATGLEQMAVTMHILFAEKNTGDQANSPTKAPQFLAAAGQHMQHRAALRDSPQGERSMSKTVKSFNAIYDTSLTEEQGWRFMELLKIVRGSRGEYLADDYEDGCAYSALAGEAASRERRQKNHRNSD